MSDTGQAALGVLRLIDSDMLHLPEHASTEAAIEQARGAFDCLTSDEQSLVSIAETILWPMEGVRTTALGRLDRHNRRAVVTILIDLYLGSEGRR